MMKYKVVIFAIFLLLAFGKSTFANQPLNELQPSIPTDNATNQSIIDTDLSWSWTGGTVTYEVYFGTDTLNKIGTTSISYYPLSQLVNDTWYIWKIIAVNGTSTDGGTWTFKTIDNKPPGTPTGFGAEAIWWDKIQLTWIDNYDDELDFTIQKKTGATGIYSTITTVKENTTSCLNENLSENTIYYYWITVRDGVGYSNYSQEVFATTPLKPQFNPYDNLFDPTKAQQVKFKYTLSWAAQVKIKIYTLDGILVKTVVDDYRSAGQHNIDKWNGRDEDDEIVASGIYLACFDCGYLNEIKKIAVIK
ncbi:MAG: FlgD immunoglobulin-like domain containing protein [Nitrospirota bacterium]